MLEWNTVIQSHHLAYYKNMAFRGSDQDSRIHVAMKREISALVTTVEAFYDTLDALVPRDDDGNPISEQDLSEAEQDALELLNYFDAHDQ